MLAGKRALITGSSRGIGLGVAQAFASAGATIFCCSEQPYEACIELHPLLGKQTDRYLQVDLRTDRGAIEVVQRAEQILGGLDILVNNVGTFNEPPLLDITRHDFERIFGINVWSALACSQEFARLAITAKRPGRILFTSSLNGSRSEPAHTLYDASKGAMNALIRQLAIELAPHSITTAGIAPGLVETPLTDFGLRSDPAVRQMIEHQIPVGKIATVADIAHWYVFLASDAANYGTGIIIPVDGGLDAQQMGMRPIAESEKH
ncbi:MAG: SDR family oxidoreductase [Zavarzinella sp.]